VAPQGTNGRKRSLLLWLVQGGLERLYRIHSGLDVRDFVVEDDLRQQLGQVRCAREQLLVRHDDEGLWLGLFVDPGVLANLEAHDPRRRLDEDNLGDLCLTVEGVSHFVYLVFCASQDRPVSQLEMELQGEIDKYATCVFTMIAQRDGPPRELWQMLFRHFALEAGLSSEERERYLTANAEAGRYAAGLDERFVRRGELEALLRELRLFYRLGFLEKLEWIARRS
jgi:hypothetical protein